MNPQDPATKQDLRDLRAFVEQLAELDRAHADNAINGLKDQLLDAAREMQTEILRAFHKWSSPVDIKIRHVTDLEIRLNLLEERITDIERKNQPPH